MLLINNMPIDADNTSYLLLLLISQMDEGQSQLGKQDSPIPLLYSSAELTYSHW